MGVERSDACRAGIFSKPSRCGVRRNNSAGEEGNSSQCSASGTRRGCGAGEQLCQHAPAAAKLQGRWVKE